MLKFNSIENGEIFTRDFRPLAKNNEIAFPTCGEEIVAIYGPNGTGKTSLIKALSGAKGTKVKFEFDDITYTSGSSVFHVINDQNNRNIIVGETKDFFLGDNIKREFELQKLLADARVSIVGEIVSKLKTNHSISAMSSPLLTLLTDVDIAEIVKDIVNSKSKGAKFETDVIIMKFAAIPLIYQDVSDEQQAMLTFFKSDYAAKDSIIQQIEKLAMKAVVVNPQIHEVEENTEAIRILDRFHKSQCIVCDSEEIDWEALLLSKTDNRTKVIEALDKDVQTLIQKIIALVPENDPFNIKTILLEAISAGNKSKLDTLVADIATIKKMFERQVMNELATVFQGSDLPEKLVEYQKLLEEKPEITEEDMLYIEEIISNSMSKTLTLERDDKKNLRITLSNSEFLGKVRDELPLSTGEQNFLSLTFEFLKAKNSSCPIVIIDDPISSFDSIYKNKVVYAIVKMLHRKKRIILTHNTDLLRLLDGQYKRCYKLYLLNNTDGEENGFIRLNNKEQDMLISLEKLLAAFRGAIFDHIKDVNLFLISMIPFMRGYANIINNVNLTALLTQVMHGYKSDKVDIAKAYIELFGNKDNIIPDSYEVSVSDILAKNVDGVNILDNTQYPLLDKTLRHSFTYLFLRLLVEKKLVEKFSIDTTKYKQLGQIISAAYPDENDILQIKNRIRLTSKKTLINEFNHFEGNLSIFQPAIDITDHALGNERTNIVTFVSNL
ncbi:AAA family ATPase [Gudongella oleilytica]|uniref:AAA family ATPase n=1 Tax=Gudongella oleilytica TaxID=1582259 RepID=UPI002A36F307|nr:AAA family ATPase [Gudongella oleilytica]MDY0256207.1 AAA family ATPase [Gudongella oleilytica]